MNQQPTTRHIEAGYRRGYHQGVNAALDAVFENRLTKEDCHAWEEQVANWRSGISKEDYGYQQPPSPFEAIGHSESQAA